MERATLSSRSGWPPWLNAAALLVASFVAVAALSFHARPDSEVVAAVFPPWWSTQHIFEAAASADASIVRTTAIAAGGVVKPGGTCGRGTPARGRRLADDRPASHCGLFQY